MRERERGGKQYDCETEWKRYRETERNRFINMEKHSERKREGEREREREREWQIDSVDSETEINRYSIMVIHRNK